MKYNKSNIKREALKMKKLSMLAYPCTYSTIVLTGCGKKDEDDDYQLLMHHSSESAATMQLPA